MAQSVIKPSDITVLIQYNRRTGTQGYDITSEATTARNGKSLVLTSFPDCTFSTNPFGASCIGVTVWLTSVDGKDRVS